MITNNNVLTLPLPDFLASVHFLIWLVTYSRFYRRQHRRQAWLDDYAIALAAAVDMVFTISMYIRLSKACALDS